MAERLFVFIGRGRLIGRRRSIGRGRIAVGAYPVSLIVVGALFCLGLGTQASAKMPTEVRVLLHDGAEPIAIGRIGSSARVRLADERELMVPGQGRLRTWSPSGRGPFRVGDRIVRGRVHVRAHEGRIQVLNRVDLEQYVASTVGGEMMASWPREALRAQAVAARTYVLHEASKRRDEPWDVLATTESQVYLGVSAETPETRAAARATAGQILTYRGQPILAVFHSTAGGRTEAAGDVWGEDRPYLRVVDVDDEEDAPNTYWRRMVPRRVLATTFDAIGLGVGPLKSLEVVERTRGGRVKKLLIRGANRTVVADRERLARLASELELPSRLFEVRSLDEGYAFVGSGHGHGVGMSQWGARGMARRGDSYKRILETFYPGARLETWGPQKGAVARASGVLVLSSHSGRSIESANGAISGGLR